LVKLKKNIPSTWIQRPPPFAYVQLPSELKVSGYAAMGLPPQLQSTNVFQVPTMLLPVAMAAPFEALLSVSRFPKLRLCATTVKHGRLGGA
jgi:hypothetical protein